jgi:hypothetical protein
LVVAVDQVLLLQMEVLLEVLEAAEVGQFQLRVQELQDKEIMEV